MNGDVYACLENEDRVCSGEVTEVRHATESKGQKKTPELLAAKHVLSNGTALYREEVKNVVSRCDYVMRTHKRVCDATLAQALARCPLPNTGDAQ